MTPARLAAARALVRLERRRATLSAEVEHARSGLDDPRDRALLLELLTGVERWRLALDAVIERAARRPMASLDAPVAAVLRLGAYQLRHLDRVPAHAVVHESVEAARALGAGRGAGFVNAVLRRIQRTARSADLPARPGPDADDKARIAYLNVTLSHPEWLVRRWLSRLPFEAVERWCQFNNAAPTITVRPRGAAEPALRAFAAAGVEATPCRYVTGAFRLPPGGLGRLPDETRAALDVQDEGSQLVALAVGAAPGQRVLDACAAPGGKSVRLAEDLAGSGLVAGDLRPARVETLRQRLAAAGVLAPIVRFDATRPFPFGARFDRVLLDAPCSGLGTLSRDPDVKWTRHPDDLPRLADAQCTMLERAADAVAPGGRLIYATCSSEPDENGDVVRRFLARRDDFAAAPVAFDDRVRHASELVDGEGHLHTSPPRHGLDAFFAAVLVRIRAA